MLPKIEHPTVDIKIPSLDKQYPFRPFLVKEEKILLMAKESEESTDILKAIKQIVNNCSLDESLNISELCIFDLEYIFLNIRGFSVDNIVTVSYIDNEDGNLYDFEVDLNQVEVTFPESIDYNIPIDTNSGFIMKYPSAHLYEDDSFLESDKEHMFELIVRCIDKIYNGDEVYESKDLSLDEIRDFLDSLDLKTFTKVQNFLTNIPKIEYVLDYEIEVGKGEEIVKKPKQIILRSLNDFFAWR